MSFLFVRAGAQMSDETPRELTDEQIDGLARNAEASVELRQVVKVLPEILLSLCHMARRGARAATLLKDYRDLLLDYKAGSVAHSTSKAEAAEVAAIQRTLDVAIGELDKLCPRLDALTGAGEETR